MLLNIQKKTFACDTSRCGHIDKLYKEHVPRQVRKQSFGVRNVNEWNNLPSWAVEAEDLEKFKHNLNTHWYIRQYLTPFPVMEITNELAITGNAF